MRCRFLRVGNEVEAEGSECRGEIAAVPRRLHKHLPLLRREARALLFRFAPRDGEPLQYPARGLRSLLLQLLLVDMTEITASGLQARLLVYIKHSVALPILLLMMNDDDE
jgi:hypothetical protein